MAAFGPARATSQRGHTGKRTHRKTTSHIHPQGLEDILTTVADSRPFSLCLMCLCLSLSFCVCVGVVQPVGGVEPASLACVVWGAWAKAHRGEGAAQP